jgi:calcineurin-like phosphoesterase family protein
MSNIFFTADTHFNHTNIIKYCDRPFSSVEEMNDTLIERINTFVRPQDTLYHLGDFALGRGRLDIIGSLVDRIACKHIRLILGNHDLPIEKKLAKLTPGFEDILPVFVGKINGQSITLNHYAQRIWNKSHYGAWHLYGHSHGTLPALPNTKAMDVGVDCHHFLPVAFEDIKIVMDKIEIKSIDHHIAETA